MLLYYIKYYYNINILKYKHISKITRMKLKILDEKESQQEIEMFIFIYVYINQKLWIKMKPQPKALQNTELTILGQNPSSVEKLNFQLKTSERLCLYFCAVIVWCRIM